MKYVLRMFKMLGMLDLQFTPSKTHVSSPYTCNSNSCRYCRPCWGIMHARKLLFHENKYHYSIFYATWNTNPPFLIQFNLRKSPCQVPLKSLPCRRHLQANEGWHASYYPVGWWSCLDTHTMRFFYFHIWYTLSYFINTHFQGVFF